MKQKWILTSLLIFAVAMVVTAGVSNFDKLDLGETPEITGSNDETISNATNGKWDFGSATLLTTGDVQVGNYYCPAARDSAETAQLIIQYGTKTVSDAYVMDFTTEGLSDFSAVPTILGITVMQASDDDSVYTVQADAVTESTLTFGANLIIAAAEAWAETTIVVHYALIGAR